MRDTYTIDGQTLDYTHTDLWTGERVTYRYWLPSGGGYVHMDISHDLSRPGTLGKQPTDSNGSTWDVRTIQDVKKLVQAQRRRERRFYLTQG